MSKYDMLGKTRESFGLIRCCWKHCKPIREPNRDRSGISRMITISIVDELPNCHECHLQYPGAKPIAPRL